MEAEPRLANLADPQRQASVDTIASILKVKGSEVFWLAPGATVYEAIAMMADRRIGCLAVLSGSTLVGVVSERDYARKVILRGKASRGTQVSEIMTSPVVTVTPEHTVYDGLRIMSANRIRHLIVTENGKVAGVVSIGDLVKSVLSMQAHTIDQLETYITNKYPE